VPQESSIMNTLSDITNIENNTEVIFVHAFILNNLLFVFSHFRKKLNILISVGSQLFLEIRKCIVDCIFNSVNRKISCINKT
jgi:hypothetical protein